MAEPIEITEKDLIDRPLNEAKKGEAKQGFNPTNFMKQLKGGIEQVKELMDMAQSMGLNINLPGFKNQPKERPTDETKMLPGPENIVQQFNSFLALLQMKYGDVSLNELLRKLKEDLGDKKISELKRRQ